MLRSDLDWFKFFYSNAVTKYDYFTGRGFVVFFFSLFFNSIY